MLAASPGIRTETDSPVLIAGQVRCWGGGQYGNLGNGSSPYIEATPQVFGVGTASDYAWERRIDALESFLTEVAAPRTVELDSEIAPDRVIPPRA